MMKALVLEGDRQLTYKDVGFPVKTHEKLILVKVRASGICGSDIERAFKGKAYHYPLIMGHEFAGEVEESFTDSKFRKGDIVTIFPLLPCRQCIPCQTGSFAQCVQYDYYGSRRDGGFAQYLYVPEENLLAVPDHVAMTHAAMTEPAAVALHGVRKLSIQAGSTAVVYGCGPIGNITAQWLRIHGCHQVIVVDVDTKKLNIASQMGFITINSLESDPVAEIMELTGNTGADMAIEAVGLPVTFLNTINSVGRNGQVVFMGNIQGRFDIEEKDFSNLLRKELTIYGTWNSKIVPSGVDDWSTVLKFMDKELHIDPLISHTPELHEGEQIFDDIINKRDWFNKVVFKL